MKSFANSLSRVAYSTGPVHPKTLFHSKRNQKPQSRALQYIKSLNWNNTGHKTHILFESKESKQSPNFHKTPILIFLFCSPWNWRKYRNQIPFHHFHTKKKTACSNTLQRYNLQSSSSFTVKYSSYLQFDFCLWSYYSCVVVFLLNAQTSQKMMNLHL